MRLSRFLKCVRSKHGLAQGFGFSPYGQQPGGRKESGEAQSDPGTAQAARNRAAGEAAAMDQDHADSEAQFEQKASSAAGSISSVTTSQKYITENLRYWRLTPGRTTR